MLITETQLDSVTAFRSLRRVNQNLRTECDGFRQRIGDRLLLCFDSGTGEFQELGFPAEG